MNIKIPLLVDTPSRIASYNEVANAYPSEKALKRIAGMKLDQEEWAAAFEAELGELFKTEFFRVVLDEGHAIRNSNTKSPSLPSMMMSKILDRN